MLEFSVRKKLHGFLSIPEEAGLKQQLGFHHRVSGKTIEVFKVKDGESFLEGRTESPFGKASLQRHLASLKSSLDPSSGTGLLTLGSLAGGLAMAGTDSPSDPFSLLR